MAKLTKGTARKSAQAYFTGFNGKADARFRVIKSDKGVSVQFVEAADDADNGLVDRKAAEAEVNEFLATCGETAIFGVTRDAIGLGIGLIGAAAGAKEAAKSGDIAVAS